MSRKSVTLSMVYKGQREIGLVLAPNFFFKICSPGHKVAPIFGE